MKVLEEELIYLVLSTVEEIPVGLVSSYKDVATFIGRPKNARLVGKILSLSEYYGKYPCHRVVNQSGRIAPNFQEQKRLLQEEGVTFRNDTHVDMKKHRWKVGE